MDIRISPKIFARMEEFLFSIVISLHMNAKLTKTYDSFTSHYQDLNAYIRSKIRSPSDAADIVQDTFLRVFKLKDPDKIREPRSFLFRTALNLAIDRSRKGIIRQRHMEYVQEVESVDYERSCPYRKAVSTERFQRLRNIVGSLPAKYREALILHKYSGMSHAEIAKKMGVSVSSVEKYIMKAMKLCRDALQDKE